MDVLLFILNLFIFGHAGSSLRRRSPPAVRAETPGAVLGGSLGVLPLWAGGWRGAALLWGRASGCSLLWAGLLRVLCGWGLSRGAALWAGLVGCYPCGRGFGCCPCGRGFGGAALLWGGASGCCPFAGRSWWGRTGFSSSAGIPIGAVSPVCRARSVFGTHSSLAAP